MTHCTWIWKLNIWKPNVRGDIKGPAQQTSGAFLSQEHPQDGPCPSLYIPASGDRGMGPVR